MELLLIFIAAIFVNNIVFSQFLGICPFLGVSKKIDTALGMSAAVAFVLTLATIVTYLIQKYVLDAFELQYLQTITFILVIASLVQMLEIVLKKDITIALSGSGCVPATYHDQLCGVRCGYLSNSERFRFAYGRCICFCYRYRLWLGTNLVCWYSRTDELGKHP